MTKVKVEVLDRRQFVVTSGAAIAALAGLSGAAHADAAKVAAAVKKLTGGNAAEGKIKISLPEIAENGNTVPIKVSVESPMTADDYVKSVTLLSEGNPSPDIASYNFTPQSGKAFVAARIRMAKTQNVVGIAEMSNGKFYVGKALVKVTIGGCGG